MQPLFVILAAHVANYDVEVRLIKHATRWRLVTGRANVSVVGNVAAGAESDALDGLARRAGLAYVRNEGWPSHGWEVGAYKAGAAALARSGAPPDAVVVFAQDSLELLAPARFAAALDRWAGTPACLQTFPHHVALTRQTVARLRAWLGTRYDETASWSGCTFNSFVAAWTDVAALDAMGLFAPAARDRFDATATERFFGYVLSRNYDEPAPLCGRDLFGKCGLNKAHLGRPQR